MMWCLLIEAFRRMGKNPASFHSLSGLVDQVPPQRTIGVLPPWARLLGFDIAYAAHCTVTVFDTVSGTR
jgi:hypothetical protein